MAMKEQERFKRACRDLAGQIGTPGYQGALKRWFAAYAAMDRPETTTLQ